MTKKRTNTLIHQITQPFRQNGRKWPDDRTSASFTFVSRSVYTYFPYGWGAGSSTTHSGGVVIYPSPHFSLTSLGETSSGSGVLTDLSTTGTARNLAAVDNLASITAMGGQIRCTGMGIKITYQGTELNRAGRFVAGHPMITQTPVTVSVTGTQLSALSTWNSNNQPSLSVGDIQRNLRNVTTSRVSDGTFEAHWLPSKVPSYMAVTSSFPDASVPVTTQPTRNTSTTLNQVAGYEGIEEGQSALVVLIDGDVTPAAASSGNPYGVEAIWHWEFIPDNLYASIVEPTPSPFNPMELALVLNSIQHTASAMVSSQGYEGPSVDSGPAGRAVVRFESPTTQKLLRAAGKVAQDVAVNYFKSRARMQPRAQRLITQ